MGWRDAPAVNEAPAQGGNRAAPPARWQSAPQDGQPQRPQSYVSGLADQFFQGASYGFGDELEGVEAGLAGKHPDGRWLDYSGTFGERARAATEAERTQQQAFQQAHPWASVGAQLGGALATGGAVGLGRAALRAPSMLRAAGLGAVEGAGAGAVAGAGYAEGGARERAEGAAWGAGVGAATGGVFSGVTGAIGQRAARRPLPEIAQLSQATDDAYQAVDNLGITYSPQAVNGLVDQLQQTATASGLRPQLHTTLNSFLQSLDADRASTMTPRQIEQMRRQLRGAVIGPAVRAGDNDTARIAYDLLGNIDSFMQRAGANQVLTGQGNVAQGLTAMQAARAASLREHKAELVAGALQGARDQADVAGVGGNVNNAVRQQLRRLITNKSTAGLFNAEETAAIRRVMSGDPIDQLLRIVGSVSPERSGLMAYGAGAGALMDAANGPGPMTALPVVGFVANRAANARQAGRVNELEELVRRGLISAPPAQVRQTQGLLGGGVSAYTGGRAGEAATASGARSRQGR